MPAMLCCLLLTAAQHGWDWSLLPGKPRSAAGHRRGLEIPSRLCLYHDLTSVLSAQWLASDPAGNKAFPWAGGLQAAWPPHGCGDHGPEEQDCMLATQL